MQETVKSLEMRKTFPTLVERCENCLKIREESIKGENFIFLAIFHKMNSEIGQICNAGYNILSSSTEILAISWTREHFL